MVPIYLVSNFIMKTKLPVDIETLLELILSREDNLIHQKLILCRSLELHRGSKEPIPEISKAHKLIHTMFIEAEEYRNSHEESIFRRYENAEIQSHYKSMLFGFISKAQRAVKCSSNKLHSILNASYESIVGEAVDHQLELRQFGLENINKEVKLGVFLKQFQGVICSRYRRQLGKFLSFYPSYGHLIDKRSDRPLVPALKQERYRLLTTQKSVELSIKCFYYYLNTLNQTHTRNFLSSIKGIKNIDLDQTSLALASSLHQSIKEDGFCEVYISKIQKLTKELFQRNAPIQKILPRTSLKDREFVPQLQSRNSSKAQRESFNSRRSVCESVNKNLRSSNIQNLDKEGQKEKGKDKEKEKGKEKPNDRRSVLRQTLVEIVLGDKQIHSKHADPHTSDVFLPAIKDKHLRNQAGNMYRRIYCLKESS